MTVIVSEIYEALLAAGVDKDLAAKAAKAVLAAEDKEQLATKADLARLQLDLANLEVRLIKWNLAAMAVLTSIFAAIVKLL